MPRQLKRRSDAISRSRNDAGESEDEAPRTQRRQRQRSASSEPPPPTQSRRRRSSSTQESEAASSQGSPKPGSGANSETTLIKKLVRLALATEYSRPPLRRSDISTKIFKDANSSGGRVSFAKVFEGAQKVLRDTFGMQLVELPSKDKTTLKERRTQATQTKAPSNSSSRSWILTTTLPKELKTNPILVQPALAPSADTEANYTALYTFILSLIYLNSSSITDQKLERYLKRVNADTYTPLGNKDKLLQRMMKEGYIDRRRDTSSGEEIIEWVPGPRGKIEVGVQGVMGLVRTVYGYGAVELSRGTVAQRPQRRRRTRGGEDHEEEEDEENEEPGRLVKIEEDELNAKLSRSLGIRINGDADGEVRRDGDADGDGEAEEGDQASGQEDDQPGPSGRGGQRGRPSTNGTKARRRRAGDDSSD